MTDGELNNSDNPPGQEETELVITDIETHTLQGMPGHFNQLIYLSSLRDYNTGRYHHYGLETRYSPEVVDAGLHHCHIRVFEELMALPLKEQTRDLVNLFGSIREERPRLINTWQHLRSYQVLPPEGCHPLARQLFDTNIEVILKVLRETDLWALLHEAHGDPGNLP
jgi:hypothetical protein